MKILRTSGLTLGVYELARLIWNKGIRPGQKFGVSWKKGKRRKLRTYKLIYSFFPMGDDAAYSDPELDILSKGKVVRDGLTFS